MKLVEKTKRQLARIKKRKSKASAKRETLEAEMSQHLLNSGWKRCGPLGDVWKHDNWKPYQENPQVRMGYVNDEETGSIRRVCSMEPSVKPWKSGEVFMNLRQAYKNQMKLEAIGYEPAKTLDDDLADLL